jgi:hypothetical protein
MPAEMTEREQRETFTFLEEIRVGTGPINAGVAVGWSPAKVRRLLNDPDFAELVSTAKERLHEDIEATVYRLAKNGHVKAIQMVLYNERSEKWKDVRHINVQQHSTLDIGVVESVKTAARELLREQGVAALQQPAAAIEATAVEA